MTVSYSLVRYKRSKHIRIFIKDNGTVKVTTPLRVAQKEIEETLKLNKDWILTKIAEKQNQYSLIADTSKESIKRYKRQALDLVLERLQHYNQFYSFNYNKVIIRNQQTRWGSCSTTGTLSFNIKILFLPPNQRDYIIVHELCHLKEFNHSNRFWNLVEKTLPDYKSIKKQLSNRHQMGLM